MARRDLLHKDKLDEFAAWTARHGYHPARLKGPYEVLRLKHDRGAPTLVFFARVKAREHVTVPNLAVGLVLRWMHDRERGRA